MLLKKLNLYHFKNITEVSYTFSNKLNCFIGANGVGKSNILDAIHYLCVLRSHVSSNDQLAIQIGQLNSFVNGLFYDDIIDESNEVKVIFSNEHSKKITLNAKPYKRISEHIGKIPIVLISPENNKIIHDGSIERRKFLDILISQQNKIYLEALISYNQLLKQRNSMLKEKYTESTLYEVVELQMERYANTISNYRRETIKYLTPSFQKYYHIISSGSETIEVKYLSNLNDECALSTQLKENREKDLIIGYTRVGIHRDDIQFLLNSYPVNKIASQGQTKTVLIALKLAEYEYLETHTKQKPLLLLDDIFDRLDPHRVHQIVSLVSNEDFGQIFITDSNRKYIDEIIQNLKVPSQIFEIINQ